MGALTITGHPEQVQFAVVGSALMLVGGALGAPAAWRGSWWLEGPAALTSLFGLSIFMLSYIIEAGVEVPMPLSVARVTLLLLVGVFYTTRALRVWGSMYRPGVLEPSKTDIALQRVEHERQRMEKAAQSNGG